MADTRPSICAIAAAFGTARAVHTRDVMKKLALRRVTIKLLSTRDLGPARGGIEAVPVEAEIPSICICGSCHTCEPPPQTWTIPCRTVA